MSSHRQKKQRSVGLGRILSHPWRIALFAYFVTRLPLVLFAWLLHHFNAGRSLRPGHFLFHGGEPHSSWLVDAFQKWDSYWFLNIVREGYRFVGPVEQVSGVTAGIPETNVTPFPLYPLAMKVGGWITGDPAVAGLLVSQICLLLSFWLLYKLARLDLNRGPAEMAVWFFALVPWTYAFSAIYSEALFFCLVLGSIYAARSNRFLVAGILGMLASLTRLPGVLVAIPVFLEILAHRKETGRAPITASLALMLIPFGSAAYLGYLWWLTGEPFAYFIGQQGWHKELVVPWHHVYVWITSADFDGQQMLDLTTTTFAIAILVVGFDRIRFSYWAYLLVSTLVLLSSSYLLGLPRYLAAVFPVYFVLAGLAARRPGVGRAIVIVFALTAPPVFWVWSTWRYAF